MKTSNLQEKKVMEKYRFIKNKSQVRRNVSKKKPEKYSPEIDDLVDGQANHGGAKVICNTVPTELVKDKPTSKFEVAAFAKYVLLGSLLSCSLLRKSSGTATWARVASSRPLGRGTSMMGHL